MSANTSLRATACGSVALVMWSLTALLAVSVDRLPIYQVLTCSLGIGSVATLGRVIVSKRWQALRQPRHVWLIGGLCITLNLLAYYKAFRLIPPAEADLIYFLWPLVVLLFTGFLPKERFTLAPLIGGLLGFVGVASLLLSKAPSLQAFSYQGYFYAWLSGLAWAIYTLFARTRENSPNETIGLCCGLGACITFACHLFFEKTMVPTGEELAILLLMGCGLQGMSLALWEYGIKQGNLKLLGILSYGTPVLSVCFLVLAGRAEATPTLGFACALVCLGGAFPHISRWLLSRAHPLAQAIVIALSR